MILCSNSGVEFAIPFGRAANVQLRKSKITESQRIRRKSCQVDDRELQSTAQVRIYNDLTTELLTSKKRRKVSQREERAKEGERDRGESPKTSNDAF